MKIKVNIYPVSERIDAKRHAAQVQGCTQRTAQAAQRSDNPSNFRWLGILNLFLMLLVQVMLLTRCSINRKIQITGVARSVKSYKTAGSWYTPQKNYRYNKVGLASWYGPGFHGRPKAQGEKYDQYSMTAAHRTLPLPTIAKVTNLSNGRSIVVVIDDRGPYKNNRIIDLSVSAARELDMYHKGVGKVCVQALPRESEAFSAFLKQNCGKFGTKTEGLTWAEIYAKNIGGKNGCAKLTTVSNRVRSLNDLDKQRKQNTIDEQRKIRELLARADDNELSARARRNRNTSNLRDRIVVKRTVVSK